MNMIGANNVIYIPPTELGGGKDIKTIAKEIFPDLDETDLHIFSDGDSSNRMLMYVIEQIENGYYKRLYIENLNIVTGDNIELFTVLKNIMTKREDFEIVTGNGQHINVDTFNERIKTACEELKNNKEGLK